MVRLQPRGGSAIEAQTFDRVINCSGPDADPRRADSDAREIAARDGAPGCRTHPESASVVDPLGRLLDRQARIVPELYYLGPWLRARDMEATAVHELRLHATALADLLSQQRAPAPFALATRVPVDGRMLPRSGRTGVQFFRLARTGHVPGSMINPLTRPCASNVNRTTSARGVSSRKSPPVAGASVISRPGGR